MNAYRLSKHAQKRSVERNIPRNHILEQVSTGNSKGLVIPNSNGIVITAFRSTRRPDTRNLKGLGSFAKVTRNVKLGSEKAQYLIRTTEVRDDFQAQYECRVKFGLTYGEVCLIADTYAALDKAERAAQRIEMRFEITAETAVF